MKNTDKTPKANKRQISAGKNRNALKHGSYAAVLTVIVLIVAIVVNVLASALVSRFPINIDLTANKDFSMTQKNVEYIKKVQHPVTITMCAAEVDYTNGQVSNQLQNSYGLIDPSSGKYYQQMVSIAKEYSQYSDQITLQFADPQLPSFTDIKQRFPNDQIAYGDILVESSFEVDGKAVSRNRVIKLTEMFQVDSTYASYGMYTISGSNMETDLTSAIYSVTADKTNAVCAITGHSTASDVTALQTIMEKNNYAFSNLDNLLNQDIPTETDIVVITAPNSDFTGPELEKLDAFLDNNGQRGKTLLFFAGSSSPDLPNLYDFLDEWGIHISTGTLYETGNNFYMQKQTTIPLTNSQSDFTKSVNGQNGLLFIGDGFLPMTADFTTQGNRTTTELLSTGSTVVVRPAGVGDEWKPTGNGGTPYAAGILSKDTIYAENMAELNSYVVAFSSVDLISEYWLQSSYFGNGELVIATLNATMNRDADDITITMKTINNLSFTPNEGMNVFMMTFFMIALPIITLIIGIIVWVRRKNR